MLARRARLRGISYSVCEVTAKLTATLNHLETTSIQQHSECRFHCYSRSRQVRQDEKVKQRDRIFTLFSVTSVHPRGMCQIPQSYVANIGFWNHRPYKAWTGNLTYLAFPGGPTAQMPFLYMDQHTWLDQPHCSTPTTFVLVPSALKQGCQAQIHHGSKVKTCTKSQTNIDIYWKTQKHFTLHYISGPQIN